MCWTLWTSRVTKAKSKMATTTHTGPDLSPTKPTSGSKTWARGTLNSKESRAQDGVEGDGPFGDESAGGEGDDGVVEIHNDDPPEEDEIQQLDLAEHGRWKDREGFRPVGVKHEEEGCTDGEKEKFEPADPSP
tara:strand:+ start:136 stop:534 length:399 start_codon:yes stop_codon:yes gene_type:complete